MSVSVNTSIWQLIFLSNQSSMAYLRCTSLQKVFQNVYHSEHWLSYRTSIQFCWFPNQTIRWKAPFISKDTGDFITQLSRMSFNSDELLLATMDIASLYTNIPHSSGLSAPSFFLMLGQVKFPLLTSYSICLKLYWQKIIFFMAHGTVMGASFTPDYANLFMVWFEYHRVYNSNPFSQSIVFWKRWHIFDLEWLYLWSCGFFSVPEQLYWLYWIQYVMW